MPEFHDNFYEEDYYDAEDEALEELINNAGEDDICTECDGAGETHGQLCKACQGTGRV
jgi:DnaJ-class molecular chaperone